VSSDVSGVRVLVTGGSSGLGRAMARGLAERGARVVVTGRSAERISRVASELTAEVRAGRAGAAEPGAGGAGAGPGTVAGVAMDVRDEAGVLRAFEQARQALGGGLDVLVNNAGLGMRHVNPRFLAEPMPFWAVPADGFREVVDTNLTGYFLVARAVAPYFVEQGHGKIVNISMNHATMRRTGFVPYGPSRAGTESLSAIMAADLAGHGVTVNMLLPGGATATGMIPEGVPGSVREGLLDPMIMAEPVRWLCSADSDGVTGERLVATGFADWLARRTEG
jgi:NAD(P)-dependent dehydrogenase (short-subunit alcohol dehydrogenase family)